MLTQQQKNLLIGTLLGDGNLQTQNNGITWRYRAVNKLAHESYILHKYNLLKDFCSTAPSLSVVMDSRTNKQYSRYTFQTRNADDFLFYGKLFYEQQTDKSWKKIVPSNIATFLTPEALAYWYMDDGALKWKGKSNAVRLCTDSFSSNEVELLKKTLESFGLKVSIQKKDGRERLSILEESYPTLKELIVPFLIPCMYYKFPDGNKGVYEGQDISNDIYNKIDVWNDENPEF